MIVGFIIAASNHKECVMTIVHSRFYLCVFFISVGVLLLTPIATANAKSSVAAVQLAQVYEKQNIDNFLVSEKYDGIRAIWKNGKLRTRQGNIVHAPKWFTQDLPKRWLDGELWYERENFEYVASTVSKLTPVDREWKNIKYMVFDAPSAELNFRSRAKLYTALVQKLNVAHIQAVKQFTVHSNEALAQLLEHHTANGAEGLMLHKADAMFSEGRSGNLLKLKKHMDDEALVLKHFEGKGKYKGYLGALLVQYQHLSEKPIEFKIGSGFSDRDRQFPPPVGSVISFKYYGFTKRGVPRFASYIRVRSPY